MIMAFWEGKSFKIQTSGNTMILGTIQPKKNECEEYILGVKAAAV
jgi:hypothetical protein